MEHLVPAFLEGDTAYVHSFLCTYRGFATTRQVLELLFQRCVPCPSAALWAFSHLLAVRLGMSRHLPEPRFAPRKAG
mgnify:FL=1